MYICAYIKKESITDFWSLVDEVKSILFAKNTKKCRNCQWYCHSNIIRNADRCKVLKMWERKMGKTQNKNKKKKNKRKKQKKNPKKKQQQRTTSKVRNYISVDHVKRGQLFCMSFFSIVVYRHCILKNLCTD